MNIYEIDLFSNEEKITLFMTKEKCFCGCKKDVHRIFKNSEKSEYECVDSCIIDESSYISVEEFWLEKLNSFFDNGWIKEQELKDLISSEEDLISSEEDRRKALQRLSE